MLSDEEYIEQKKPLKKLKKDLTENLNQIAANRELWFEQCEEFIDFTSQLDKKWKESKRNKRKLIMSFAFGSTTILQDQKLDITSQLPFIKVAKGGIYIDGGTNRARTGNLSRDRRVL